LHRALSRKRIEHAFGGALALAYWTEEPRGTRDIDLNLFVPADAPDEALSALPKGVARPPETTEVVKREGQIRLWWDDTPIDLFFDYVPIHREAARNRRVVPFEGERIPVLGPVELALFKAMFDRTRDWADIEAMIAAGTIEPADLHEAIESLVGSDDSRHSRLDEVARRANGNSN
jgi:hypothetical protein